MWGTMVAGGKKVVVSGTKWRIEKLHSQASGFEPAQSGCSLWSVDWNLLTEGVPDVTGRV